MTIDALDRQAALAQLDDQTAALVRDVLYALDRTRFAGSAAPSDLEARVRAAVTALGVA